MFRYDCLVPSSFHSSPSPAFFPSLCVLHPVAACGRSSRQDWLRHPNLSCVLSRKVQNRTSQLPLHSYSDVSFVSLFPNTSYSIFKSYLTRANTVIVTIGTATVILFGVVEKNPRFLFASPFPSGSVCPVESNRLHPETQIAKQR